VDRSNFVPIGQERTLSVLSLAYMTRGKSEHACRVLIAHVASQLHRVVGGDLVEQIKNLAVAGRAARFPA
jgi:hypothetical protein